MKRNPAVAGQFYPENPQQLKEMITSFKKGISQKISSKGVILPHAGYIYSGKVAVQTIEKILPEKRLIILGPNHTGLGKDFSVYRKGSWFTPLGEIKIDEELADFILKEEGPLKEDTLAHQFEHSIEVELPILQYFFGQFIFVPIICREDTLETYKKIAEQIYKGIKKIKEEVLVIASSDMTHYEPDSTARRKDRLAIEAILNLDVENFLKVVKEENITICGVAPISITLILTKLLKATKAEVVLYQTSADVNKDYSSVVGYLGAIIS